MNQNQLRKDIAPRSVDQQQACSAFLRTINGDLYTEPAFTALDDCYEQGQAASSQGFRRDQNPYPKGTAQREWWDGGHCNETDELTGQ